MKKVTILCATLAVVLMAAPAMAQLVTTSGGAAGGVSFWYDVRPTVAEITTPVAPFTNGQNILVRKKANVFESDTIAGNAGGPGDAEILRIAPRLQDTDGDIFGHGQHWTCKKKNCIDRSVANLYLYATVSARLDTDDVIAAVGSDAGITKLNATAGNPIESVTFVHNAALFDGTAETVTQVGSDWTVEKKAVKVPVAAGPPPVYSSAGSISPDAVVNPTAPFDTIYQVGTLTVAAGESAAGKILDSTWELSESVNNLLITRTYNGVGPTPENVDFGYLTVSIGDPDGDGFTNFETGSTGIPELAGSGSMMGTTSTQVDAVIRVHALGDNNDDGVTNSLDVAGFNAAVAASTLGTLRQRELYLNNFNNDTVVNSLDVAGFNAAVAASTAGCPVPGSCP